MMTPLDLGPENWSRLAAWQNVFLSFFDQALFVLFGLYLHRQFKKRAEVVGWRKAMRWRSPSTDAAVALTTYFFGMSLMRSALWLARYEHIGEPAVTVLVVGGLAIVAWAMTCLLRVFGDAPLGSRAWIIFTVVDLIVSTALTMAG